MSKSNVDLKLSLHFNAYAILMARWLTSIFQIIVTRYISMTTLLIHL